MLGTHNSLTYLKPKSRFKRLFGWMARCQNRNILTQWARGARCFDIRVRVGKDGFLHPAHGSVIYKELAVEEVININELAAIAGEKASLRVLYESTGDVSRKELKAFADFCEWLETLAHVVPFLGKLKHSWTDFYPFKAVTPPTMQPVGSMSGNLLGRIFPWLWAKTHKSKVARTIRDNAEKLVLIDFI